MVADSSTTLRTLADRVEREAPSRELDGAIWEAIGLTEAQEDHCKAARRGRFQISRADYLAACAQEYTRSLDAAVTLVPEHYSYELTHSAAGTDGMKRARLWDWRRGPLMSDPGNEWKAEANTSLPSVLCAAALRAIAEGEAR